MTPVLQTNISGAAATPKQSWHGEIQNESNIPIFSTFSPVREWLLLCTRVHPFGNLLQLPPAPGEVIQNLTPTSFCKARAHSPPACDSARSSPGAGPCSAFVTVPQCPASGRKQELKDSPCTEAVPHLPPACSQASQQIYHKEPASAVPGHGEASALGCSHPDCRALTVLAHGNSQLWRIHDPSISSWGSLGMLFSGNGPRRLSQKPRFQRLAEPADPSPSPLNKLGAFSQKRLCGAGSTKGTAVPPLPGIIPAQLLPICWDCNPEESLHPTQSDSAAAARSLCN